MIIGMFATAVIGFIAGVVLTLLITKSVENAEPEHEHDWVVRGAQELYNVRVGTMGLPLQRTEEGVPITEVLYRCDCGAVETETLTGHWTYEQLSGVAGANANVEEPEGTEPTENAGEAETSA